MNDVIAGNRGSGHAVSNTSAKDALRLRVQSRFRYVGAMLWHSVNLQAIGVPGALHDASATCIGHWLAARTCANAIAAHGDHSTNFCSARCTQLMLLVARIQVAAHASHHIRVSKSLTPDGRAITRFEPLTTHTERCREVADMMGGGLDAAERMLAAAQGWPGADAAEASR